MHREIYHHGRYRSTPDKGGTKGRPREVGVEEMTTLIPKTMRPVDPLGVERGQVRMLECLTTRRLAIAYTSPMAEGLRSLVGYASGPLLASLDIPGIVRPGARGVAYIPPEEPELGPAGKRSRGSERALPPGTTTSVFNPPVVEKILLEEVCRAASPFERYVIETIMDPEVFKERVLGHGAAWPGSTARAEAGRTG